MKQKSIPKDSEAYALIEDTTNLIQLFSDDFTKHCTRKGCVVVRKESDRFEVTVTLKRKKEKK